MTTVTRPIDVVYDNEGWWLLDPKTQKQYDIGLAEYHNKLVNRDGDDSLEAISLLQDSGFIMIVYGTRETITLQNMKDMWLHEHRRASPSTAFAMINLQTILQQIKPSDMEGYTLHTKYFPDIVRAISGNRLLMEDLADTLIYWLETNSRDINGQEKRAELLIEVLLAELEKR